MSGGCCLATPRASAQKAFDPIASVCKETRLYIFISIDFFFFN